MKGVFASVALVLTLSTVPAIAAPKSWMTRSPRKLKAPVTTEFNIARDYYKRTVFLGSAQSLTAYVKHWGLKVQIMERIKPDVARKHWAAGSFGQFVHKRFSTLPTTTK